MVFFVTSGTFFSKPKYVRGLCAFLVVIYRRVIMTFASLFELTKCSDVCNNQTFWFYVLFLKYNVYLLLFCLTCFPFGETVHPYLVELSFTWSCLACDSNGLMTQAKSYSICLDTEIVSGLGQWPKMEQSGFFLRLLNEPLGERVFPLLSIVEAWIVESCCWHVKWVCLRIKPRKKQRCHEQTDAF